MNYPVMRHLLGAYFHQDFDLVTGDMQQTFDAFVHDEPERLAALRDEISAIMQSAPSEDAVDEVLDELGCEIYLSPDEGGYRGWLAEMLGRIDSAQAEGSLRP